MSDKDTVEVAVATPEQPQPFAELGLTAAEYATIGDILGRRPTAAELALYSVMWSEHCSYKSSKVHLKRLAPNEEQARMLLAGIGANAGVVDIGQGYAVTFKIESHNHPSFVEPHQGAATGVGGVGAFAALQRDEKLLPWRVAAGPHGVCVRHRQPHVAGDEPQPGVPGERARQQVRLAEDLEAVADPQDRQPRPRGRHQLGHHRGEPGDRATAQVIAVREPSGQDHRVNASQIAVGVPERMRLCPRVPDGTRRVLVVK